MYCDVCLLWIYGFFQAYSRVLIFKISIRVVIITPRCCHNAEHFSALLPTTRKDYPHCCLQLGLFSALLATTRKKCSNSVPTGTYLIFRIIIHNTDDFSTLRTTNAYSKNDQRCCVRRGKTKLIGENCSNSNTRYLHEFAHMRIYTLIYGHQNLLTP